MSIILSPKSLALGTPELLREGVWYLASPYSHRSGAVRKARFEAVSLVAGFLYAHHDVKCFCPIAMSSPIEEQLIRVGVDTKPDDGYVFWEALDEAFFPHMAGCIRCLLPGWTRSNGMRRERDRFTAMGKPVFDLNPEEWFGPVGWNKLGGVA